MKTFTILHTSDWHLGHQLYRARRLGEFEAFLQWLGDTISQRQVDLLLLAGDVFDTAIPPASAQQLYFDFLGQAVRNGCRHIVITAGNHDSPTFLTAPRELLRNFQINVVGNVEDAKPLLIKDAAGNAACIVSPLPYLRAMDLRGVDSEDNLLVGLRQRYQDAAADVETLRQEYGDLPAIAMGHLFVSGASMDAEGERVIQVGNLDRIPRDIFPPAYDYVALGHIHRPQIVAGDESCRYSGSPLPMSFAESAQHKSVALLTFAGRQPQVEILPVPLFRRLVRLEGSREGMLAALADLLQDGSSAWVEMQHDGSDALGDLNNEARQLVEGYPIDILCIKAHPTEQNWDGENQPKDLNDCSPAEIFATLLDGREFEEEKKSRLMATFHQLCADYEESIRNGE